MRQGGEHAIGQRCCDQPGNESEAPAKARAGYWLEQAAEKAGSLDTKQVAEVMHSGMVFKTVLGDISYDKKGDRKDVDYVMYTWKKMPDVKIGYETN